MKEDIIAAATAIYSNYAADLITGTSDPDVIIPKMKSELEQAGIDELLEDVRSEFEKHLSEES